MYVTIYIRKEDQPLWRQLLEDGMAPSSVFSRALRIAHSLWRDTGEIPVGDDYLDQLRRAEDGLSDEVIEKIRDQIGVDLDEDQVWSIIESWADQNLAERMQNVIDAARFR